MTNDAPLAQGFMFVDKRAALRCVTLETSLVFAEKGEAAAFQSLLHVGSSAFDGQTDVRIVAISTTHPAFQDRMAMGQLKLPAHVEMALEAGLGRFTWVNASLRGPAAFDV